MIEFNPNLVYVGCGVLLYIPWKISQFFIFGLRFIQMVPCNHHCLSFCWSVGLSVRFSAVCWSVRPLVSMSEVRPLVFSNFCMKLGHHKGTVTEWQSQIILMFLSISLHPVIKIFWNFTNRISLILSKTSWKLAVQEKSGSGCIIETRPLFLSQ